VRVDVVVEVCIVVVTVVDKEDEDDADGSCGFNFDSVLIDCDNREADGMLMFVRPMCGTGTLACKCIAPRFCLVVNGVLLQMYL
jgi:hypothetical protein